MTSKHARPVVGRVAVSATLVVTAAIALTLGGCTGGDPESSDTESPAPSTSTEPSPSAQTPTAQSTPTDRPTTDVSAAIARAGARQSTRYAEASAAVLSRSSAAGQRAARTVATGRALNDLLSIAGEYADKGWYTTGAPKVVGKPQVVSTKRADAVRVLVCLDNSAVVVHDSEGSVISNPAAPQRSLNVLRLVERDGRWLVVSQVLPPNATC
ncbi:exported hypothetical protein [metagenome]|uniref:Lipoprotein n=1 Tax=metagenome TaxID=256318 RepID=A0A2P2BZF2_9ZZZZ